jgi:amidase
MPVDIISEGVISRTVRDTARAYAGFEQQYRASALRPIGAVAGPAKRRLRIGLVLDSINGVKTDDDTRAAVTAAAELLAGLGHDVTPVEVPITAQFEADFKTYWGLLATALRSFGNRIYGVPLDRSKLDGLTVGLARYYRSQVFRTPAVIARLRHARRRYARMFAQTDVVLSPVLAHTTPLLGYLSPTVPFDVLFPRLTEYVTFTPLHNAAGAPALSLPMGESATGLPIGAHFSAAHGDERTLLELAFEIEQAQPWRRIQDTSG